MALIFGLQLIARSLATAAGGSAAANSSLTIGGGRQKGVPTVYSVHPGIEMLPKSQIPCRINSVTQYVLPLFHRFVQGYPVS
jgi:hypothetical protein